MKHVLLLSIALGCVACAAPSTQSQDAKIAEAQTPEPQSQDAQSMLDLPVPGLHAPKANLITGGQPEADAWPVMAARGVTTVIAKAKGYKGHTVRHSIETPERYLLQIQWETLENHTVDFRGSPAFGEWRAIVGPFFAAPPVVEHFTSVL